MNLRNLLRKWICPELLRKDRIREEVKLEEPLRVPFHEHEVRSLWEEETNLAKKMAVIRNILRSIHRNNMAEINTEMGAMFFKYPFKKQIAVKVVLKELIDYLGLEVVTYKQLNGELIPAIERKMNRYVEL